MSLYNQYSDEQLQQELDKFQRLIEINKTIPFTYTHLLEEIKDRKKNKDAFNLGKEAFHNGSMLCENPYYGSMNQYWYSGWIKEYNNKYEK